MEAADFAQLKCLAAGRNADHADEELAFPLMMMKAKAPPLEALHLDYATVSDAVLNAIQSAPYFAQLRAFVQNVSTQLQQRVDKSALRSDERSRDAPACGRLNALKETDAKPPSHCLRALFLRAQSATGHASGTRPPPSARSRAASARSRPNAAAW